MSPRNTLAFVKFQCEETLIGAYYFTDTNQGEEVR